MSNPQIINAVAAHLEAIQDLPKVVYPNEEIRVQPPFIIFDFGLLTGKPITIDGVERFEYRPQVSLMAESGSFTAEGAAVLWSISQAFKFGTAIRSQGVKIAKVIQTPTPDNGFADNGYFRRSMVIPIYSFQEI